MEPATPPGVAVEITQGTGLALQVVGRASEQQNGIGVTTRPRKPTLC